MLGIKRLQSCGCVDVPHLLFLSESQCEIQHKVTVEAVSQATGEQDYSLAPIRLHKL